MSGRVRRERVHEAAQERDRLLAHGAVTDEHRALADALGLREGKHSAASIARIALAEFERLRALSRVTPRALAALVARLEADADGLTNRSFGADASRIPYAEHAEAARALLALVKGLEGE